MKIVFQEFQAADIEEHAAVKGAQAAAKGHPPSTVLFTWDSPRARELRFIYELAYEMEKESNALYESSKFQDSAIVINWNDRTGWGTLRLDQSGAFAPFSYHVLDGDWISEGEEVDAIYEYLNGKIKVITIKTPVISICMTPKIQSPKDV